MNITTIFLNSECSDFSECSKSCGGGNRECQNTCRDGDQPGEFGNHCPAELEFNRENCNEQNCPELIDCEISEECSATCGGGVKTCTRTCLNGEFGNGCDANLEIKSESCNENACPTLVECNINSAPCSVTCGSGTKMCENTCENGQFGVDPECLESNKFQEENCDLSPCPEVWVTVSFFS